VTDAAFSLVAGQSSDPALRKATKTLEREEENVVLRRQFVAASLLVALVLAGGFAVAAGPTFEPGISGDGHPWSTQGVTVLPAPNEHNRQSFDKLFVVTNSSAPGGQRPVSETAPRNPHHNGSRWFTHTVDWTEKGFLAHGLVPVLKSYDDILLHEGLGHLTITRGSFDGGPPPAPLATSPGARGRRGQSTHTLRRTS